MRICFLIIPFICFIYKNIRSGDTTARIWSIPESGRSISTLILKHAKGKSNEKCKDVTTLDWNVSSAL